MRTILQGLKAAPYQPLGERLRQLRMALLLTPAEGEDGACVVVTSSVANEGKTMTTLSLALMESLSDRRCVVLDFDLRRSRLAATFDYAAPGDLAGVLSGEVSLDDAIYALPEAGFDLITLRRPGPHLSDQTRADKLREVIAELKRRYQVVLVDTGPVLLVSDTLRLAPLADQVLLLVRQNRTRRNTVKDAARRLEDLGARSISVAMTMADPRSDRDAYGAYGSYDPMASTGE